MRISWLDISERINHELQQREEDGGNISELRIEWDHVKQVGETEGAFRTTAELFYRKLEETPYQILNEQNEPTSWNEIVRQCTVKEDSIPALSSSFVEDRVLGGWLGRSAGCLLGKPIEKMPRSGIVELLSSNGTWPISDYITGQAIPDSLLQKYPWNIHNGKESLKENIVCMPEDDDMNFAMLNLSIVEEYGKDFTTEDVAQAWLTNLPVLSTFTAERVAYMNYLHGMLPPDTAVYRNPYREWIGAQIRADLWGWISPAQPARAAEYAWRDARLSHVRNGMYGEMFFAAAIAASFKHSTVREVINDALKYIPSQSRFAQAIRFVMSIPIQSGTWDETVNMLYSKFGKYHWVHSINNSALVVAALLSSAGNYERGICNVVMGGWDTDSNGATVGSIMGTMLGANKLPPKWIVPLNNHIRSSLKGFDKASLGDLAKRTAKIVKYAS